MAQFWQHPYVNLFKQFNISTWKKWTKEGEVIPIMDCSLKSTVFKITGAVPAANYINLPKSSSQPLFLTGRYLYLLLQPLPGKYFVVHIDTATNDGLVIRLSFSNLFKEFKSTSTWLQFPYICNPAKGSVCDVTASGSHDIGPAPQSVPWTVLCMDLQQILVLFLNRKYLYLKGIRLCANMNIKNLFTSDLLFEPGVSLVEGKKQGLGLVGLTPMPRAMAFPLARGSNWHDHYNLIRFPFLDSNKKSSNVIKYSSPEDSLSIRSCPPQNSTPSKGNISQCIKDRVSWAKKLSSPKSPIRTPYDSPKPRRKVQVLRNNLQNTDACKQWSKTLQPNPILRLKRIVGFGGHKYNQLLWDSDSKTVVYPCQNIIVAMDILTENQRLFIGHTNKVSCIALSNDSALLASGQTGSNGETRVWDFKTGTCLAWSQVHYHSLSCLSFAPKGQMLCGVGKDIRNRNLVVIWETAQFGKLHEIKVSAKAFTDVHIEKIVFCHFDDSRLVSCGYKNIRFWRLKDRSLCSVGVSLGEYGNFNFTDLCFPPEVDQQSRKLFVSSDAGFIFEIDYLKISIKLVRRLLPSGDKKSSSKQGSDGIPINSISINDTFCVTGSEDGYLCLWSMDFAYLYLEASHQGPVSAVQLSPDGLRVLTGTKTGHLGILDMNTRKYRTIMRCHTSHVLNISLSSDNKTAITISEDMSIRIWDMDTSHQLYHFKSEDNFPTVVCCSPTSNVFACGFKDGLVRVFNISPNSSVAVQRVNSGCIVSLIYSPSGDKLYCACSDGMLVRFKATDGSYNPTKILSAGSLAYQGSVKEVLAVSPDGQSLTFIGPTPYTVTSIDSVDLRECWITDITYCSGRNDLSGLKIIDMAEYIVYTPTNIGHLLVSTMNKKLIKIDALTGCLISEVADLQKAPFRTLAFSKSSHLMVTADSNLIKVWDYDQPLEVEPQSFIGHSGEISKLIFTPCGNYLFSVGDAILLWEFLGPKSQVLLPKTNTLLTNLSEEELDVNQNCSNKTPSNFVSTTSIMDESNDHTPRRSVPLPATQQEEEKSATTRDLFSPILADDPSEKDEYTEDISFSCTNHRELQIDKLHEEGTKKVHVHKHYTQKKPIKLKYMQQYYLAPPEQAGLTLKRVIGYNGNGRNNLVWNQDECSLIYSLGCVVVVQDVLTGDQIHLIGHSQEVITLAVQHDRKVLASASCRNIKNVSQIFLWDLQMMTCLTTLNFHKTNVICLSFSVDDKYLISVGDFLDPQIVVWNTEAYTLETSSPVDEPVHEIQWSPHQSQHFTTVGQYGTILFWMLEDDNFTVKLTMRQASIVPEILEMSKILMTSQSVDFTCAAYATESVLFIGTNTGLVTAWNIDTHECFLCWYVDDNEIGILTSNGQYLVTGSVGGSLKLYSVANICATSNDDDIIVDLQHHMKMDGAIIAAKFDEKCEIGVVGTDSGTIFCVNWDERSFIHLVSGHMEKVNCVAVCSKDYWVSGCNDGILRIWTKDTWEVKTEFYPKNGACTCVAVSPTIRDDQFEETSKSSKRGQSLVAAGYSNGMLRLFDLRVMKQLVQMKPHAVGVTALTFTPDGHTILSGASDGIVAITNAKTGMTLQILSAHKGVTINNIDAVFLPKNLDIGVGAEIIWLATGADSCVSVWASGWSQDCKLIDWIMFKAVTSPTDNPVTSPTDDPVTSPTDDPVTTQSDDNDQEPTFDTKMVPSLARFSPEDPQIIVYSGSGQKKVLHFYDLLLKKVKFCHNLNHWAQCFNLSSTCPFIVLGGEGHNITLMDFYEGSFQDFLGHNDMVHEAQFSPDGQLVFTAAYNEIFVWKVLT